MAEVYEAAHTRFSAHFAVKVLLDEVAKREDVLKRFQREAEVTSALRHPNIVNVVDFNRLTDGTPYLVMEFLDGVDLAARVQAHGRLSLVQAVDLVGQLADALSAAHSQNIVHRDLKPQNLFLVRLAGDGREVVKILDFGISKVREATTKLTRQSSIIGTPQYMAPEQARGLIEEIDERTDQFSLAAITYELVTGQPPFRGEAVDAILYQVVHESPAPFARPMSAVEKVVLRGMSKEKAERYASVRAFHLALAEAAQSDEQRPAFVVPPTLLTPDAPLKAEEPAPREPTEILHGRTTLGSAAKAVSRYTAETENGTGRLYPVPILAVILLAGAGLTAALLWPRQAEVPLQPAPAASPAPSVAAALPVTPDKDASPSDVRPDLSVPTPIAAQPEPTATPSAPTKDAARSAGTRKKKSRLRMEDL